MKLEPFVARAYNEVYWSTEDDFTPVVSITNFTDVADVFDVFLTTSGSLVALSSEQVGPRGTVTLNLRQMIESMSSTARIKDDFGGLYIKARNATGRLLVKQHAFSARKLMMAPYYGSYDYITLHYFSNYPVITPYDLYGYVTVTTCYSSSGCFNDQFPFYTSNSSIVSITGTNQIYAQGVGTASLTSTASGAINSSGAYGYVPASAQVEVQCARPTNFRQDGVSDLGNGVLRFNYVWDTTMGTDKVNLRTCQINEFVTYPTTTNPYNPGAPFPSDANFPNPTSISGNANSAGFLDTHSIGSQPFQTPYYSTSFNATQTYRWRCQCYDNNEFQNFPGFSNITITRSVSQINGVWTYTITKSGSSATKTLP